MPENSEDPEVFAAAAILMSMHQESKVRAQSQEKRAVRQFTGKPCGGYNSATNNAVGLRWEPQRVLQATGYFTLPSVREQEDREMMDEREQSFYEDDHAASSGILESQKPEEVYRPQPQSLAYYNPTANGGREQRIIPRFVDFNSAKSVLDADETHRLAVWRRNSNLGLAGLRSGTFGPAYTNDYDDHTVAQHAAYADQNGGYQIPLGIPGIEQSNLWLPDQNRTQESASPHNNRDQRPTSVCEGRTRNQTGLIERTEM